MQAVRVELLCRRQAGSSNVTRARRESSCVKASCATVSDTADVLKSPRLGLVPHCTCSNNGREHARCAVQRGGWGGEGRCRMCVCSTVSLSELDWVLAGVGAGRPRGTTASVSFRDLDPGRSSPAALSVAPLLVWYGGRGAWGESASGKCGVVWCFFGCTRRRCFHACRQYNKANTVCVIAKCSAVEVRAEEKVKVVFCFGDLWLFVLFEVRAPCSCARSRAINKVHPIPQQALLVRGDQTIALIINANASAPSKQLLRHV